MIRCVHVRGSVVAGVEAHRVQLLAVDDNGWQLVNETIQSASAIHG